MLWQTEQQLEDLLCEVVSWDSRTRTEGEIQFAEKIKGKLLELEYFRENPDLIQFHDAGNKRNAVTALYKQENVKKTIVLISHFDTVHITEFGVLGNLAFQPRELTKKFREMLDSLPEGVRSDVTSGDYLFGRGTMDMKMGIVLHLHLLEQAIHENWPINLLLVTVPDEEVNSSGMLAAVKGLVNIQERYDLEYTLFLNSEPSFSMHSQDEQYYIYSGTIGKIMPSALFYGRETHAGEPLQGINAHYMASFLTKKMEYNQAFSEEVYGERTPLPVCLKTYDLKADYSTQTSNHVAALYNVFLMKRNAKETLASFREVATEAMEECAEEYKLILAREENSEEHFNIGVWEYEELLNYARDKLGKEKTEAIIKETVALRGLDQREISMKICDQMMTHCQEIAPACILFFAPPYYPAINSSRDPIVQHKIALAKQLLQDHFDVSAKQVHYFNGICDLSYVNYDKQDHGWQAYKNNTPVWNHLYTIPFDEMQKLQAPVLNIGPFGKDAHKLTERLHKQSAFVHMPFVLRKIVESMFEVTTVSECEK
ncbi:M20/M25/M40 family metallo-hydrolase [Oceanobacillus alkalisoli]|uniref:M20/M25/M40 family metallo-hydrolase n=1 Tax=Oceanobacillus alkalisoli TaxID=2925113 RepID=UPI001F120CDD|nr:M20/M25/M40 family metallo-hydrolase [Oceanobacillus alkalisoli]MCF3942901.1 M20/M25/M40 family metallo-hydrolase [Oceanobacillus alkalisoli]